MRRESRNALGNTGVLEAERRPRNSLGWPEEGARDNEVGAAKRYGEEFRSGRVPVSSFLNETPL
ncbi:hypothetical protein [Paenibacillus sp. UMB7766-LJ446]|uniref:hypothetical protein n=1 Tax=Paenibacillus sp. UMB7766-LJ446 TaxID=3046313 RepID=UPI00254D4F1E|nr:hypothetical protein [Paenibacillus sp. UMB7766-LJ446]